MFKLVIQDDEGKTTTVPLIRDEITIGRKEGNTIRLTERNVSRRHARILRNNGEVHIEDLGSYNGIRVNNARIAERVSLRISDQVQIGDYKLYLKAEGQEQGDEARTIPLDRLNSQVPTEAMPAASPGFAAPVPMSGPLSPVVGNGKHVPISEADANGRTIGPATREAVAALTATGGYGKLVVLSSNFAGKEFELSRPQMIIGRTDENDLVINHRSISRNHAKLVREPETQRYTISDLQSSNGVRVNGQDYGKVELRRGDVVDLGHVRLRFVEAGEDFVFARDAVITDVPDTGGKRGMLVAVLAAAVVLVAGVVLYSMRDPAPRIVTPGTVADAASVAVVEPGPDVVIEDAAAPAVVAPTPVLTPTPTGKPDEDKALKARCLELQARQDWQALIDCTKDLEAGGGRNDAKVFRDKALKEQANELKANDVRQALKDKDLKKAEDVLREIGDGSVYFKSLRDQLDKIENIEFGVAMKRAQAFVNSRDCAGLKQWKLQVAATLPRNTSAIQNLKCVERTQPPDPAVVKQPPPTGGEPPPVSQAPKNPCETMNIDDLLSQAENQYRAGYPKPALALLLKVLPCKQDVRMFRLAVTYACEAKDAAIAKSYFVRVPTQFQANLEQKCQQQSITVRAP